MDFQLSINLTAVIIFMSVSVGITEIAASDSITSFINRADSAPYTAKSMGRNQVSIQPHLE